MYIMLLRTNSRKGDFKAILTRALYCIRTVSKKSDFEAVLTGTFNSIIMFLGIRGISYVFFYLVNHGSDGTQGIQADYPVLKALVYEFCY